ncbi:MAG: transcriptional regulator [Bacteroidetes bacterium]|nr:MAG: transcriptional regulator [Bacteroidota bacterium]
MARKLHIDSLDKRILTLLLKDVRIPFVEVARQCNVTGSAIHQRVQKLIENEIIDKKTYKVNPKALGYLTLAYVGMQINLVKQRTHQEVFNHISSIPEVVECHNITGKYSFLLKIYAQSNEHLKSLLVDKLQSVVEVVATETFISLEEGFSRNLPIEN